MGDSTHRNSPKTALSQRYRLEGLHQFGLSCTMVGMNQRYLILFSLSGLIISCDQMAKHLAGRVLNLGEVQSLAPLLSFTHQRNQGFVFGLFRSIPDPLNEMVSIGVPFVAISLIVLIFLKSQDGRMASWVALSTIVAGAVSNLFDRIRFSYVLDCFVVTFGGSAVTPPFNIADIAIVVGVLMVFYNTVQVGSTKTQ